MFDFIGLRFGLEFAVWMLCVPILLPVLFFSVSYCATAQKGWILGVLIPNAEIKNAEVTAVCKRFKRSQLRIMLLTFLLSVPLMFGYKYFSPYLLYAVFLITFYIVLAGSSTLRYNKRLRALKTEKNWKVYLTTIDKEAVRREPRPFTEPPVIKTFNFALPWVLAALTFVPYIFVKNPVLGPLYNLFIVVISQGSAILLHIVVRKMPDRALADDPEANKKVNESQRNSLTLILFGFAVAISLIQGASAAYMSGIIGMSTFWGISVFVSAGLLILIVYSASKRKSVLRNYVKTDENDEETRVVRYDDENWLWGLFYYNREDDRLFVSCPFSLLFAVNLARKRSAVVIAIVGIVVTLLVGLVIETAADEFTPHKLELADAAETGEICLKSLMQKFSITICEIEDIQFLEETPKIKYKNDGFSSASLKRGDFNLDGYPKGAKVMIYDENPAVVMIKAGNTCYFYNEKTREATMARYVEMVAVWEMYR